MAKKSKAMAMVNVPQSRDEVVETIAKIGSLQLLIEGHKGRANEAIREIGKGLEENITPVLTELNALEAGVQAWCEAHRAELTNNGKVKYHNFTTGKVNWRQRPPGVSLRKVEAVLASCKALGLSQFIRVKEEINKDAMLAEQEKAAQIAGVTIKSAGEDFVIEPTELETAAV
ncbi:host-nuclease inhibitor Gam family protein [Candidatus Tokpelaia sp.]|uniref:host-nuclease inhibitor Gam family protein n=1 Tax=Candidatus Tokpelaia sp. TaxID=2233777 RepID=UPI00123B32AD|nr:host-nuclease inhibitor Gam family protein [Candidatus Tokpelaia sp.]KAA6405051.1 nuclease inhibitor protein [Candidatus Tokpelaia sp.]